MLRLVAAGVLSSVALAQTYFSAALEGAQEVPPVLTAGRGWSIVRVEPFTQDVRIVVFHEGLSGPPTAAHLHVGAVGVSGAVILPLVATGPNEFTGTGVLPAQSVLAVSSGGTYVNVHTAANPNGEIRGQVVESVSTRYACLLDGAQVVPPTSVTGGGIADAFLYEPENRIVYLVTVTAPGLTSFTGAHFHQASPGVNGPIIAVLNGPPIGSVYYGVSDRLTAAQLAAWKANGCYLQINTVAFPNGAIRGQMLQEVDTYVASLDGSQMVPPTPAGVAGFVRLSRFFSNINVSVWVDSSALGLAGPVTSAFVGSAPPGVIGPSVFPLQVMPTPWSSLQGSYVASAAQLTELSNGNWYVHVNTQGYPSGYLRGQLGPAVLPTTFGEGCPGSSGVRPQIGAMGILSLGGSTMISLNGAPPNSFALFAFGAGRDNSGPIPLPVALGTLGIGSHNCYLFVEPTTLRVGTTNGRGFAFSGIFQVPVTPALRGQSFYSQWFPIDTGAFIASNALSMTVW